MGTRALIQIENSDIVIYQHWDGDPESTLPILRDIVSKFFARRGDDPEYLAAYLIFKLKSLEDDSDEFTGFGLLTKKSARGYDGIEFTYFIGDDGGVKYKVGNQVRAKK